MININAIHAKSARGMARYLLEGTIDLENPLDRYAREVAAGETTFSEATDELVRLWVQAGGDLDKVGEIEDRVMDRLRDAAVAIQEAQLIRYRPDMPERMAGLLGVDGDTMPTERAVTRLIGGHNAEGQPIEGKRYAVERPKHELVTSLSLTFNAAKGPSLIHGFAESEQQRREVQRAHQGAVEATLQQIEEKIGVVMVRPRPCRREPGGLGWVSFFQDDSRRGDPHMHSHVAVFNVVASQESDRVGSIYYRGYHGLNMHFTGVYQAGLSRNLARTGWDAWYDPKRIECRVRDIPDVILDAFSARRKEALVKAEQMAIEEKGRPLLELAARQRLALINRAVHKTRPDKGEHKPDSIEWGRRLAALGWELEAWGRRGVDLDWRESRLRI